MANKLKKEIKNKHISVDGMLKYHCYKKSNLESFGCKMNNFMS